MKLILITTAASVAASALAACNVAGPYASATGPSPRLLAPNGYQTLTNPHGLTCGPDIHVCHYENRDRRDRWQQ